MRLLRTVPVLSTTLVAALTLGACGGSNEDTVGDGRTAAAPNVVATTTIVGDLVRAVAGERARVTVLLDPNADPHDYEPRPSDVQALADADIVVRSGGDLDAWTSSLRTSSGTDARDVALIQAIQAIQARGHDDHGAHAHETSASSSSGGKDPHWWQDVTNARRAVTRIERVLSDADADGASVYAANAQRYRARLTSLDRVIARCVETIPAAQRKLVTNHDAFAYFADRYGLEVVGTVIPGLSTRSQASAGAVTQLVDTIRDEGVPAIFSENTVSSRLQKAIAERGGAKLGAPLLSDALGPKPPTDTYLGMMRANAAAIGGGLGGDQSVCSAV